MTSARAELLKSVDRTLGHRRLVWAGLRAADAESLCDLPQFHDVFSIIGELARVTTRSVAYEAISGYRPDLEAWSIDDRLDEAATGQFRRLLLAALSVESALVPYRASEFLSAVSFARQDRCTYLGQFGGLQAAFEHKPWVETQLKRRGVDGIEWVYIADEEQLLTHRLLENGPVVLRRSRTSGGEGVYLVHTTEELAALWPRHSEGFVSVSAYLADAIPLNVGATVWRTGEVSMHLPSVQLIGIPACVGRPFGYCGNDFGLAKGMPPESLAALGAITSKVGEWLHDHGYVGSFGIDSLLLDNGRVLFLEVNPRFQGSTSTSSRISAELDLPCLPLEHIAAHLGLDPIPVPPLPEQLSAAPDMGIIAIHRRDPAHGGAWPSIVDSLRRAGISAQVDSEAALTTSLDAGALACRLGVRGSITTTGFDLLEPYATLIERWQRNATPEVERA